MVPLSLALESDDMVKIKKRTLEFTPAQLSDASRFIESLPPGVKVDVHEWVHEHWRFVFGEPRDLALGAFSRLTPGARFRVRPVSILR